MSEKLIEAIEMLELIEEEDFAWYIDKDISKDRIESIKIVNKELNKYAEIINFVKEFKSKVIKQKKERAKTNLTESSKLNALEKFLNILLEKIEED